VVWIQKNYEFGSAERGSRVLSRLPTEKKRGKIKGLEMRGHKEWEVFRKSFDSFVCVGDPGVEPSGLIEIGEGTKDSHC